jgi:hypothetical protein
MAEKKQILYCYDGEFRDEDTVIDPDGTAAVPEKGAILRMHGQNWRVTHVGKTAANADGLVAYKLYLARA